jgi:hypothetical protein
MPEIRASLETPFPLSKQLSANRAELTQRISAHNEKWRSLESLVADIRDAEIAFTSSDERSAADLRGMRLDLLATEVYTRKLVGEFLKDVQADHQAAVAAAFRLHKKVIEDLWAGLKKLDYEQKPEGEQQQVSPGTIAANPRVRAKWDALQTLQGWSVSDERNGNAELMRRAETELATRRERAAAGILN